VLAPPPPPTDFEALLRLFAANGVEVIVVGGFAGNLHGSARATFDLDVVYRRTNENLERLITCLKPYQPYLRGAPPGLPFQFDAETLQKGLNFTFTTRLGDLDLLGENIPNGYGPRTEEVFRVYDREGQPCDTCGAPIRRIKQGGRSTYFCARCQR